MLLGRDWVIAKREQSLTWLDISFSNAGAEIELTLGMEFHYKTESINYWLEFNPPPEEDVL